MANIGYKYRANTSINQGKYRDVESLISNELHASSFKSLNDALKSVGEKDISLSHRKAIAIVNSISNYKGSASQNLTMLKLLKAGKLVKV